MPHVHLVARSGAVLGAYCLEHRPVLLLAGRALLRPCDGDCQLPPAGADCLTCAKLERVGTPFDC